VEIEMARPEAQPVSRRDRSEVRQHAALECEHLKRAGILGLTAGGVVAARDQDRRLISWRGANLVRIDAGIELARLAHRLAEGAIAIDAMHRDIARVVISGEQISAGSVDAGVNRTRRQRLRLAMQLQPTRERIDAEGGGEVRGASEAGPAVARHDVEISLRGMRPGILHVGRQGHRAALFERGACDVDLEQAQLRAGAGIKDSFCGHVLTHARSGTVSRPTTSALNARRSSISGFLRMGGLLLNPSVARMPDRRNHPSGVLSAP
jgi:hypothetical protein